MTRPAPLTLAAALLLSSAAYAVVPASDTTTASVHRDALPLRLAQATTTAPDPKDPNAKPLPKKGPPPAGQSGQPGHQPGHKGHAPNAAPPPSGAKTAPPPSIPKTAPPPSGAAPVIRPSVPPPPPPVRSAPIAPPPTSKPVLPPPTPMVKPPAATIPPPVKTLPPAPPPAPAGQPAPFLKPETKLAPPPAPSAAPVPATAGQPAPTQPAPFLKPETKLAPPTAPSAGPQPAPAVAAPAGQPAPTPAAPLLKPETKLAPPTAPSAAPVAAPTAAAAAAPFIPAAAPSSARLQDVQQQRTQRVEDGGKRTIIQEPGRVIIKQDNRVFIQQDENARFRQGARDFRSQQRSDGLTETVIVRPGGVQIINVTNPDGRLVRRYRREGGGREVNLIDNRSFFKPGALAVGIGIGVLATAAIVALAPPAVAMPRHKYIVDYDRASRDDIYEALSAPPIEHLERGYSLEEIRYSDSLRDRMRRIDLDSINFASGSWIVDSDQYGKLEHIAHALSRMIDRDPGEVFMIEGHTDAVGSDVDNVTLSDRRAESVADILSTRFNIPPENLVTQGYGEQFLKVPTDGAERANRRVAVRRITPLLARSAP